MSQTYLDHYITGRQKGQTVVQAVDLFIYLFIYRIYL